MLFNLDKQTKHNILEHYKREALFNRIRKEEEKKRELEEDRNNLEQKEIRQKETIDMMNKEKLFNKNKLKNEYNLLLQKTKGYFPRKNDIIINNWGKSKEEFILPEVNNNKTPFNENTNNKSYINEYIKNNFVQLTAKEKEKIILKQIDHMNDYLTDKQNVNEVRQFFRIQKENRHNFYKDLLFSQYKDAINKNLNLYGTKDELLLKQRKSKNITVNPYIKKRNYDSGHSSLEHNPIINPENNYNYNKYINYKNIALYLTNNDNNKKVYDLNSFDFSRNNNKLYKINSFDNYLNNFENNDSKNLNNNNNFQNDYNTVFSDNYRNNNNNNISINLKKNNTIQVNKNILSKIPKKNDNYVSLDNEKRLKISKNIFNLINNISPKNNGNSQYNLRKNFSQGDIYFK
jgi:hypothetical protein